MISLSYTLQSSKSLQTIKDFVKIKTYTMFIPKLRDIVYKFNPMTYQLEIYFEEKVKRSFMIEKLNKLEI